MPRQKRFSYEADIAKVDEVYEVLPEDTAKAVMNVAAHSQSPEECNEFLRMLGIHPKEPVTDPMLTHTGSFTTSSGMREIGR